MVAIYAILTSLAVASTTLGRVVSMSAPSTAKAGEEITAVLQMQNYIQNWQDFGVVWGILPVQIDCATCVGQQLSYNDLYGHIPVTQGNASFSVPIPSGTHPATYNLVAAIPHLAGASGGTGISFFNQTLTIS